MVEASSSTTMTFFLRLALVEQRIHFVEERCGIDGLGEIAVHAKPEAALLVLNNREDDDGNVHCGGIVLEHGGDVEAVHLRHHDVENDEAGRLFADERERFAAIFGEAHGIAGFGEFLLQQRANVRVVVDDQDRLVARLVRGHRLAQLPDQRLDIDGASGWQQRRAAPAVPAIGSVNENVLPWPGSLSTQMRPP